MLERPGTLGPEDWDDYEQVTLPAVLQCSGNGRGFFTPKLSGVPWAKGGVGNAEWSGVRLRDVLQRAGIKPGAAHVHLLGADPPPNPKTPAFLRSIPLDRAMADDTILATRMNGEPLPVLHGGPLRLVVPTWTGNHWIKWLRWVRVEREEAPGFYMQVGYRIAPEDAPPGAELKPEDLVPLTTMNVKSLFARPSVGAVLPSGRQQARGVAWTGRGLVDRVEVQIDDDPQWRPATLEGPARGLVAAVDVCLGGDARPPRPACPRHRRQRPDPTRDAPLEQERLSLERDRRGSLRGEGRCIIPPRNDRADSRPGDSRRSPPFAGSRSPPKVPAAPRRSPGRTSRAWRP